MRFCDFNIESDLQISDYDTSGKKMTLKNSKNKPVRFQIPRMYMPFGVSGFTPEVGPTKYNIDFSMKGHDEEDNQVKRFYEFLRSIENAVIENVENQSFEIFSKKMTKDDLLKIFNSNIKETAGREPKFRVKVDTNYTDNTIKFPIFDSNEKEVSDCVASNGLYSKNSGVGMVELTSVYFLNKRFGLTWRLTQLKTYEPQRLKGFQFKLDDDE
jgi:hypothetical protein